MASLLLPFSLASPPIFSREGDRLLLVADGGDIWSLAVLVQAVAPRLGALRRERSSPPGRLLALGSFDDQLATISIQARTLRVELAGITELTVPVDFQPGAVAPFHVWPGEVDPVDQTPVLLPLLLTPSKDLLVVESAGARGPKLSSLAKDVILVATGAAETLFVGYSASQGGSAPAGAGVYRLGRQYGWRPSRHFLLEGPKAAVAGFLSGEIALVAEGPDRVWRLAGHDRAEPFHVPSGWSIVGFASFPSTDLLVLSPERDRICCLSARESSFDVWRGAQPVVSVATSTSRPWLVVSTGRELHLVATDRA